MLGHILFRGYIKDSFLHNKKESTPLINKVNQGDLLFRALLFLHADPIAYFDWIRSFF